MGWVFESNDITVWEPSLHVGRLFLTSVRELERQVGEASGLSEPMSDTIEVDGNQLIVFIHSLLASTNLSNTSLSKLVHAPLVHLIALQRAVSPSTELDGLPEEWNVEATELATKCFRR